MECLEDSYTSISTTLLPSTLYCYKMQMLCHPLQAEINRLFRALLQRASPSHRSHRSTSHIVLIYTPASTTETILYNHFLSMTGKLIEFETRLHMKSKMRHLMDHGFPENRVSPTWCEKATLGRQCSRVVLYNDVLLEENLFFWIR